MTSYILAIPALVTGCSPDYGVRIDKTIVVEDVTDVYSVDGEVGYEYGVARDQAVDILFFIDESGSMLDNQQAMADTMPDIYDVLTGEEFDSLQWRAGITSTDPAGPIYGWVDHDDPAAAVKLSTMTSLLEDHAGEAGLDAAVNRVVWSDYGFFRQDADALFIFLSDEKEQSSIDEATYKTAMAQSKQDPFVIVESSIVYLDIEEEDVDYGDCGYSRGANLGTGYVAVSEVSVDLCDTAGWVSVLDPVVEHTPTLNRKWVLDDGIPAYPPEENISVFVDDHEIDWWEYEPSDNSVWLTRSPRDGSAVAVVYLIGEP
jgi:hypothetical protein